MVAMVDYDHLYQDVVAVAGSSVCNEIKLKNDKTFYNKKMHRNAQTCGFGAVGGSCFGPGPIMEFGI